MAVDREAKSWRAAVLPTDNFTHVVVDSAEWGMGKVITREQFRSILGVESSTPGLIKAGTEQAPVVLEPREEPGLYIAKGGPGFYSWAGVVEEAQSGFDWYLVWNDVEESWSLVDMGELPAPDLDNQVSQEDSKAITPKGVDDHTRKRIMPAGWGLDVIERPDLINLPILDANGSIVDFLKRTPLANKEEMEFEVIERPDLAFVVTDKDDNIIYSMPYRSQSGSGGETLIDGIFRPDLKKVVLGYDERIVELEKTVNHAFGYDFLTFVNPTDRPSYDINLPEHSWAKDYDEMLQKYDEVVASANSNPESQIVAKELYGYTGHGRSQYCYRLKTTDTPKAKILLTSGTHAAEKMYIFAFFEIFKDLLQTPYQHPTIQWIRDNCEIVFIPGNCPESLGFPERVNGTRTTPETRPFSASYESDGSKIMITYTQSDFPSEYQVSEWDEYFKEQPDKRMVTIWSTDDNAVLPRGVYEYQVINGHTIIIESLNASAATGACEIQVWTDPNRNVDNGTGIYQTAPISSSIQVLDDGTPYALYDSKGTGPESVQEVKNWIKFCKKENFDIILDGHCPPRKHYSRTYNVKLIMNNIEFMKSVKSFASMFNDEPFDQNVDTYYRTAYPSLTTILPNTNAFAIEWLGGMEYANTELFTDALRWAYTVMIGLLKHSVIKR